MRLCLTTIVFAVLLADVSWSQVQRSVEALDGVGVDEQLGQQLPLDSSFRTSNGQKCELGTFFDGERPVILSLNYSDCPMLCQLQLNGLVDALRDLSWEPGNQFDVVSVSINPLETPQRARQTKQHYVKASGKPATASGWHFLVGNQNAIQSVADAVGFRFTYLPERNEYVHAAVIMVCTPEGKISRYLYGVTYPTQTMKLALLEASEGKIGTTLDRIMLYCFHYDATAGRYAPVATRIMKVGAALTLVVLLVGLVPVWLRRQKVDENAEPSQLEKTAERAT